MWVMDVLGRLVGSIVLDVLGIATAATILPFVTFGWLRVERSGLPVETRWHGFATAPDGTIIIGETVAAPIGIALWIALGVVVFRLVHGS